MVLALMEMVVNGVSTRKVTQVTEELCGTEFSKSTVSNLCMQKRVTNRAIPRVISTLKAQKCVFFVERTSLMKVSLPVPLSLG